MKRAHATTPSEYLAVLPPDRRTALSRVRQVVRKSLPAGYREVISWGMITYEIPLRRYPTTYNGKPLCYAALAAQKNYNTLYLMAAYADPVQARRLKEAFKKAGKKFDMGKSCLHFKDADDLELKAVGEVIASTPVDDYIGRYEASRKRRER